MPELIAKPALETPPLTVGSTVLQPIDLGPITSIALFPGKAKAAEKALKPLGMSFPAPNSFAEKATARLVWTGRDQAFLIGAETPELTGIAATTDQSGGWSALRLSGDHADAVLSRHVPLDLRPAAFPVGRAVRAPLGHMSAILMRDNDGFLILTFRSMAQTAWHEIETAMRSVAARAA